jgi:hypothetical protein
VLSAITRSGLGAGAAAAFFAGRDFVVGADLVARPDLIAGRGLVAAFTPPLAAALFVPAAFLLVCFAAFLPLDFLLEPAISSPELVFLGSCLS